MARGWAPVRQRIVGRPRTECPETPPHKGIGGQNDCRTGMRTDGIHRPFWLSVVQRTTDALSSDCAENQWLFPAGRRQPGPLSPSQVSKIINDTVAERVGAVFHPHLFRALAVELGLQRDPAGHEHARQLLGHGSLQTVLAHYAPVRPSRRRPIRTGSSTRKRTVWHRWQHRSKAAARAGGGHDRHVIRHAHAAPAPG